MGENSQPTTSSAGDVSEPAINRPGRSPVHVVYAGAHLFRQDTPRTLGKIALAALETYAPDADEFAAAEGIDPGDAAAVYQRMVKKLRVEPVEDFRIDFEDGYGFRSDAEEDSHAASAAQNLADAFLNGSITAFSGVRAKPFAPETRDRGERTLSLFIANLLERSGGLLQKHFVVTLPKIVDRAEVRRLAELLDEIEERAGLQHGSIGVEIMIETPRSLIDHKGRIAPPRLVRAAKGRCTSAHFGAYDYTSLLGIAANHQCIGHDACDFARQIMLASLSPLGLRLSDSVTTEMPIPPHKGDALRDTQTTENRRIVHKAWRTHFANVTRSMVNGFYQSWDLHPSQLVPRYAAVYSFFLQAKDSQAEWLRGFIAKATQANLTRNTFDDAASAQGIVNFFKRSVDCGAISETEAEATTGLSIEELRRGSFLEIMNARLEK